MIVDETALRALIEEVVRRVVREEIAPGGAAQEEYVCVAEAARRIDVAAATIREWIQDGRLGRYHAGRELRVRLSELTALMRQERRQQEPSPEDAAREFLARRASGGSSR